MYAAGRLDKDSEGLLILTDDGPFIKKLTDPQAKKDKVYWVQVEGAPKDDDLNPLRRGLVIKGKKTKPCRARLLASAMVEEVVQERNPPVRFRQHIPTTWVEITLQEGMNRQVRRSCAAIGFPCLRLIRRQVGKFCLDDLAVGKWISIRAQDIL